MLVFTPKGDALTHPARATPVDLAYVIRTELGHHHRRPRQRPAGPPGQHPGRRGRGRILHLDGRVPGAVQGVAGLRQEPQAHVKVRQWLASQHRDDAVEAGQQAIDRVLADQGWSLQRAMDDGSLAMLDYADLEAMYRAVGQDQLSAQSVAQWLVTVLGAQPGATPDPSGQPWKMSRGRNAETTNDGTSTTSLTLRSTATLQMA